ncbi:MAG: hypothetical protein ACETWM_22780 [Candidatus Lokiarchaeia archaeon]
MSRGALLTGTAGGIIGTITAVIGIIWSIIAFQYLTGISNFKISAPIYSFLLGSWFAIPFVASPNEAYYLIFFVFSIILFIFLVVTGILVGVGFYGVSTVGGGGMGVVALIFSIIGCIGAGLLILLGNLITTREYTLVFGFPLDVTSFSYGSIPVPNFLTIGIGFLILGATVIILGTANIAMRNSTAMPAASTAAGIISIIGASFFLIGALNLPILLLIGFIMIFVASIFWAIVFFTSRDM